MQNEFVQKLSIIIRVRIPHILSLYVENINITLSGPFFLIPP